jgi:hypothetical protein
MRLGFTQTRALAMVLIICVPDVRLGALPRDHRTPDPLDEWPLTTPSPSDSNTVAALGSDLVVRAKVTDWSRDPIDPRWVNIRATILEAVKGEVGGKLDFLGFFQPQLDLNQILGDRQAQWLVFLVDRKRSLEQLPQTEETFVVRCPGASMLQLGRFDDPPTATDLEDLHKHLQPLRDAVALFPGGLIGAREKVVWVEDLTSGLVERTLLTPEVSLLAKNWVSSPSPEQRWAALRILRAERSSDNIRLLQGMLSDPYTFPWSGEWKCAFRDYPMRAAARAVLMRWHVPLTQRAIVHEPDDLYVRVPTAAIWCIVVAPLLLLVAIEFLRRRLRVSLARMTFYEFQLLAATLCVTGVPLGPWPLSGPSGDLGRRCNSAVGGLRCAEGAADDRRLRLARQGAAVVRVPAPLRRYGPALGDTSELVLGHERSGGVQRVYSGQWKVLPGHDEVLGRVWHRLRVVVWSWLLHARVLAHRNDHSPVPREARLLSQMRLRSSSDAEAMSRMRYGAAAGAQAEAPLAGIGPGTDEGGGADAPRARTGSEASRGPT